MNLSSHHAVIADQITHYRQKRAKTIIDSLAKLDPQWLPHYDWKLDNMVTYALLCHTFYQCLLHSKNREIKPILKTLNWWTKSPNQFSSIRCISTIGFIPLKSSKCSIYNDTRFDSTVYCVTEESLEEDFINTEHITLAKNLVVSPELNYYLDNSLSIAILFNENNNATTSSYTLTQFPNTVYCTYSDLAIRLGEQLLHESSHCWLNDALSAVQLQLPSRPLLWSPWKAVNRPIFGVIHACLAFSLMYMLYHLVQSQKNVANKIRLYCLLKLKSEGRMLNDARLSVSEALSYVTNTSIKHIIRTNYEEALMIYKQYYNE